ncbi:hypothetical protein HDU79_001150 [Rhizoclosmatium sp. JEL0117]|nr:hypothetical protein HDU79_001150 [Rhizoclosmatium sp. JEL0117]
MLRLHLVARLLAAQLLLCSSAVSDSPTSKQWYPLVGGTIRGHWISTTHEDTAEACLALCDQRTDCHYAAWYPPIDINCYLFDYSETDTTLDGATTLYIPSGATVRQLDINGNRIGYDGGISDYNVCRKACADKTDCIVAVQRSDACYFYQDIGSTTSFNANSVIVVPSTRLTPSVNRWTLYRQANVVGHNLKDPVSVGSAAECQSQCNQGCSAVVYDTVKQICSVKNSSIGPSDGVINPDVEMYIPAGVTLNIGLGLQLFEVTETQSADECMQPCLSSPDCVVSVFKVNDNSCAIGTGLDLGVAITERCNSNIVVTTLGFGCPPQQYFSDGVCITCDHGLLCDSLNYHAVPCPVGYFCEFGAKFACKATTTTSDVGGRSKDDCNKCAAGYEGDPATSCTVKSSIDVQWYSVKKADINGHDLLVSTNVASSTDCTTRCSNTQGCALAVYDSSKKTCWLKDSSYGASDAKITNTVTMYIPSGGVVPGFSSALSTISLSDRQASDDAECRTYCESTEGCVGALKSQYFCRLPKLPFEAKLGSNSIIMPSVKCNPGSYSKDNRICIPCDDGLDCSTGFGLPCEVGFFCTNGVKMQCDPFTTTTAQGATQKSDCNLCVSRYTGYPPSCTKIPDDLIQWIPISGVDIRGHDLGDPDGDSVPSSNACIATCLTSTNCAYALYSSKSKLCWLKDAVKLLHREAVSGSKTLYIPSGGRIPAGFKPGSIPIGDVQVQTETACRSACQTQPNCIASAYFNKGCQLFDNLGYADPSSLDESNFVRIIIENKSSLVPPPKYRTFQWIPFVSSDINGFDISGPVTPKSISDCTMDCTSNPLCVTFVYDSSTQTCWLKKTGFAGADTSVTSNTPQASRTIYIPSGGSISGLMTGDNSILLTTTLASTAEECRRDCGSNLKCVAGLFGLSTDSGCVLLASLGTATKKCPASFVTILAPKVDSTITYTATSTVLPSTTTVFSSTYSLSTFSTVDSTFSTETSTASSIIQDSTSSIDITSSSSIQTSTSSIDITSADLPTATITSIESTIISSTNVVLSSSSIEITSAIPTAATLTVSSGENIPTSSSEKTFVSTATSMTSSYSVLESIPTAISSESLASKTTSTLQIVSTFYSSSTRSLSHSSTSTEAGSNVPTLTSNVISIGSINSEITITKFSSRDGTLPPITTVMETASSAKAAVATTTVNTIPTANSCNIQSPPKNLANIAAGEVPGFSPLANYGGDVTAVIATLVQLLPNALGVYNVTEIDNSLFEILESIKPGDAAVTFQGAPFVDGLNAIVFLITSRQYKFADSMPRVEIYNDVTCTSPIRFASIPNRGIGFSYVLDISVVKSNWFSMQLNPEGTQLVVSINSKHNVLASVSFAVRALQKRSQDPDIGFLVVNGID